MYNYAPHLDRHYGINTNVLWGRGVYFFKGPLGGGAFIGGGGGVYWKIYGMLDGRVCRIWARLNAQYFRYKVNSWAIVAQN